MPIPTLPLELIMKAVLVAKSDVELATIKSGLVPPAAPPTDSSPDGLVVPTPRFNRVLSHTKVAAAPKLPALLNCT